MIWLRSIVFFIWFLLLSIALHVVFLPALVLPRRGAVIAARSWCAGILWGLRVFVALEYEVRGDVPAGAVLVASKHMSMWDTVALFYLIGDPVFVLKRELMRIPFYGWYARKVGMIAIDRRAGAAALRRMTNAAREALAHRLGVVVFPEGTRKPVGAPPDYKPGIAALYGALEIACIPVALNSGLFWTGFLKKRGRIVIQFLAPIAPGLKRHEFMPLLEERIEQATQSLLREGRTTLEAEAA
ncbi:MAG TPA: lysophospholipid acyltransferase family protein [Rhizomicrobium sp.]|jgi:1-acyl-sn-glycerol-3-phosphate acyltransferase